MPEQESVHAGHELSGVNARGVGIFIAAFVVCLGAVLVMLWIVMGVGDDRLERAHLAQASPIGQDESVKRDQPLQPGPQHPSLDWQDMAALREQQRQRLNSFGRVVGDDMHVQIPIDRAMRMVLEHRELLVAPDGSVSPQTQPSINTTLPAHTENRT